MRQNALLHFYRVQAISSHLSTMQPNSNQHMRVYEGTMPPSQRLIHYTELPWNSDIRAAASGDSKAPISGSLTTYTTRSPKQTTDHATGLLEWGGGGGVLRRDHVANLAGTLVKNPCANNMGKHQFSQTVVCPTLVDQCCLHCMLTNNIYRVQTTSPAICCLHPHCNPSDFQISSLKLSSDFSLLKRNELDPVFLYIQTEIQPSSEEDSRQPVSQLGNGIANLCVRNMSRDCRHAKQRLGVSTDNFQELQKF